MRIAKEGYPLILVTFALAAGLWLLSWQAPALIVFAVALAIAAFFRDPERVIPNDEGLVVSPADGKVVSIAPDDAIIKGGMRISIFLSPLDVHINRVPVAGAIQDVNYLPGKFLAAYKADASKQNEQNAIQIAGVDGRSIRVVQIAGVMARRIVCWVKSGDRLQRGDRFGLIMFGSRTDTFLPKGCRIEVVEGQRVKGGETVLGRFS